MKRYLMYLCFCLVCYQAEAQFGSGTPPNIEWRKTDLWPETQLLYTGGSPTVTDAQSGHDWFHRSGVRYDGSHQPIGYVHAGYSTMPAIHRDNFDASTILNLGGCGFIFDWEHSCYTDVTGIKRGLYFPIIALSDLNGNHNPADFKILPFQGSANSVIQTSDGGYIVVGGTFMSSMLNVTNGNITGTGPLTSSNITLTPIIYNPEVGNTTTELATYPHPDSCRFIYYHTRGLVVKLDASLSIEWSYLHGLKPHQPGMATALEGTDLVHVQESIDGGFIMFGGNYDAVAGKVCSFVRKTDQNGLILWTKKIDTGTENNGPGNMAVNVEGGVEYIYVAGGHANSGNSRFFVTKLDANGNDVWSTPIVYYDPTPNGDDVHRIAIATNGDLLVSGVVNAYHPYTNRKGQVYRLSPVDGSLIAQYQESITFTAADLRYCVAATSDNGCAVASTVLKTPLNVCSPQYYICGLDGSANTDAYVAKFNYALVKEWAGRVDANTMTPAGNAPDIADCGTVSNVSWELDVSALDLKRQECIFDILETPDGGLLITGKNSMNQDDCYLIKICNVSPTVISGQTISTTQNVSASYYITVDNTTVTNTGNLTMEACKYIHITPETYFAPGSIVSAQINPGICCGSESQGERLANVEATSTVGMPSNPILPKVGGLNAIIFPNPNNGTFTVQIDSRETVPVTVSVYNQVGTKVYSKDNVNAFGNVEIDLNLVGQEKGMYFLRIDYPGEYITRKFIIE